MKTLYMSFKHLHATLYSQFLQLASDYVKNYLYGYRAMQEMYAVY
jgi:hypothetical protein